MLIQSSPAKIIYSNGPGVGGCVAVLVAVGGGGDAEGVSVGGKDAAGGAGDPASVGVLIASAAVAARLASATVCVGSRASSSVFVQAATNSNPTRSIVKRSTRIGYLSSTLPEETPWRGRIPLTQQGYIADNPG